MQRASTSAVGDQDGRDSPLFFKALRGGSVVGLVLLALWVRWAIDPWLGHIQPFITFYFVVTLVAWWWGWRLAAFAGLLGLLAGTWFFLPPKGILWVQEAPHLVQAFIYCYLATAIIYLAHLARIMRDLAQARAEALREQAADYRVTFERAILGHAILEPATQRITRVNAAFCRLTGYQTEELVRLTLEDLHPSGNGKHLPEGLRAALVGETDEYQGEQPFRCKSGQLIWGRVSVASVRDDQGKPLRAIVQLEDITEPKNAEAALRQAEQKLRYHVENSPLAIIEWNDQFHVARWNEMAERVFGWKAEEVVGKHPSQLNLIHPEDRAQVEEVIARLLQGEVRRVFNSNRNSRKDGVVVHCDWYNSVLVDEQGIVVSVLSLALDVTARKEAEQRLQSEKAFSEAAINSMPGLFYLFDESLRLHRWNRSLEEMTGYTSLEVGQMQALDFVVREDHPKTQAAIQQVFASGEAVVELEIVTKTGRRIPCVCSGKRFEFGQHRGVIGVGLNISDRKRAEVALLQSKQEWERTFDSVPDLIAILDQENRIKQVNQPMARRLGLSREQCIGQLCYQCIHKMDYPPAECPHALTRLDHQCHSREFHEACLGGDFLISTTPLLDERGSMVGTVHVAHDITERKRAEEALKQQNQRLQLLHQAAGFLLFTAEPEDIGRQLHQQIGAFFQADVFLEHLVDSTGQGLQLISSSGLGSESTQHMTRLAFGEDICGAVAQQRQSILVSHVQSSDHPQDQVIKQMGVRSYYSLPLLVGNRLLGTLTLGSRLRNTFEGPDREFFQTLAHYAAMALERWRLDQELRHYATHLERLVDERTARLQEMVNELEHFSYTITHDMRAPLRAMRMFGQFLLEQNAHNLDATGKDYLQRITTSARRMDTLITDALQYSQAVQQELHLEPVDPTRLLQGMIESYPAFQPPQADIRIEGELPLVLGNEAGLTQCFSNLLNNAVQFVESGKLPQVRVRAELRGDFVRLWFVDNGIGIPRENLSRIFGMFERLSTEYEGTGIGLALVRKMAERMGGKVGVESELGKGSCFWLDLQPASSDRFERPTG